jgi:hypothetical protein
MYALRYDTIKVSSRGDAFVGSAIVGSAMFVMSDRLMYCASVLSLL